MSFAPILIRSLIIELPAAPAPLTTNLADSKDLLTNLNELIRAATTTIAVPCWSSWKTGISSSFFNLVSISTHLGAEISSKFIPPNPGAINLTALIISSVSCVSKQIGKASTSANCLKRIAFPSITGRAASGPMFPKPSTAEPSVTTATIFPLDVYLYTFSTFSFIAKQGAATPGE